MLRGADLVEGGYGVRGNGLIFRPRRSGSLEAKVSEREMATRCGFESHALSSL